jgi:hypothetical protein
MNASFSLSLGLLASTTLSLWGATAAFTGKVTAVNSGGWRLVHSHPRGPLENHLAKPQLNYGVCTREEDHSCYFVGGIDR